MHYVLKTDGWCFIRVSFLLIQAHFFWMDPTPRWYYHPIAISSVVSAAMCFINWVKVEWNKKD